MSQTTHKAHIQSVVDLISQRLEPKCRTVIAIAGPPGSGKTTLADAVVRQLNEQSIEAPEFKATILPMDGYHRSNDELDRLGLRRRKGAVDTFDAAGFSAALEALSDDKKVHRLPGFDRRNDCVVPDRIIVEASTRIIVTEGNYLLLNRVPWRDLRALYAASVFVKAPLEVLKARLLERWRDQHLSPQEAQQKVTENDLPNAALVLQESMSADLVIEHAVHDALVQVS